MAIMRGGKSAYITEINNNGVATQEELNTHEESFAHAPNAISGIHEGKYLRFVKCSDCILLNNFRFVLCSNH